MTDCLAAALEYAARRWPCFPVQGKVPVTAHGFDRTYGHLAPDAEDYERGLLDAYDSREIAAEEKAR